MFVIVISLSPGGHVLGVFLIDFLLSVVWTGCWTNRRVADDLKPIDFLMTSQYPVTYIQNSIMVEIYAFSHHLFDTWLISAAALEMNFLTLNSDVVRSCKLPGAPQPRVVLNTDCRYRFQLEL